MPGGERSLPGRLERSVASAMDILGLLIVAVAAFAVLRFFLRQSKEGPPSKGPTTKRQGHPPKEEAVEERSHRPNPWIEVAARLGLRCDLGDGSRPLEVTGGLKGHRVHITSFTKRTQGKQKTFIRVRVSYPGPLGLGLRLTREGALSSVARYLGDEDIEVGDAEFDEHVVVKSSDIDQVISFLTPARRLRAHRLLTLYPGAVIGDCEISCTFSHEWALAERIVTTIRRMVHVARHLTADHEDDRKVNLAVKERRMGRIEEAVKIVREIPPVEGDEPPPLVHKVLEAEMLFVAGHRDEAHKVFEEARAVAPEDPEIKEWAERSDTTVPPPIPIHLLEEASEEPKDIDIVALSRELFNPKLLSLDTNRLFDERYKDRRVCWTGVLESVETYPFDFVFGNQPGTKAVVNLHEVQSSIYSKKIILGVVQLPPEAHEVLKSLTGQKIAFRGRLHSVDGFVHTFYVTEAELQPQLQGQPVP